eukprot:TRINITY_DN38623_c0_g2_i2.p1 TRINITY_DN38623_c0_g2~~TRINITY_DN38623_c0_g2_i2.p1  ORF type:complete len:130 (-),score=5.88 TRINITY_DN38623_c0_g2_i2:4-393(-)
MQQDEEASSSKELTRKLVSSRSIRIPEGWREFRELITTSADGSAAVQCVLMFRGFKTFPSCLRNSDTCNEAYALVVDSVRRVEGSIVRQYLAKEFAFLCVEIAEESLRRDCSNEPVSYTHLTLPTIYSV